MEANVDELELGSDEIEATPEEQAELEQAFDIAMTVIHGEGVAGDKVAEMVLQSQDIAEGMGRATAAVVVAVEQQMQISDDVKWELAVEIVNEFAELAIEAGALAEDEVTDQMVEAIVNNAVSEYLTLQDATGKLDPNALQASVADAETVTGKPKPKSSGLFTPGGA